MTVPVRRPLNIAILPQQNLAIVTADRKEEVPIGALVRRLNSLQTLFHYQVIDPPLILGEYDERHLYNDQTYYDAIAKRIANSPIKWGIAIVSEELQEGSFNRHNEVTGCGVITVKHYKEYIPNGHSLDQYLAFLILCESFCIVCGQHLEHHMRCYCLFDMCDDKHDLIECIRKSFIHEDCEQKIFAAGFTHEDFSEAEKILSFARRANTNYKFAKFASRWYVTLELGVLIGLIASFLVAVNLLISGVIVLGFLIVLLIQITFFFTSEFTK